MMDRVSNGHESVLFKGKNCHSVLFERESVPQCTFLTGKVYHSVPF